MRSDSKLPRLRTSEARELFAEIGNATLLSYSLSRLG